MRAGSTTSPSWPASAADEYMEGWTQIAALAGFPPHGARGFIAEELLTGDEVTLEGYVRDGRVTVIGITDSVKYPARTASSASSTPTRMPAARQASCAACRTAHARTGLRRRFFNVEFVVPETGPVRILEANGGSPPSSPRSCRPSTAARPTTPSSPSRAARIRAGRRRSPSVSGSATSCGVRGRPVAVGLRSRDKASRRSSRAAAVRRL